MVTLFQSTLLGLLFLPSLSIKSNNWSRAESKILYGSGLFSPSSEFPNEGICAGEEESLSAGNEANTSDIAEGSSSSSPPC
ncbi:ORF1232 [White spot syndrome virus]|uniref:Wsv044 n=3 Tax=White spot syndrome virus TaxID=342409 RepID=Q8VBC2_WSSVS|nr:wsv044 [Shrimp white spot syndrome virus]AFX59421.1 wsv044 [White spot syndrome virus]AAL33048.1 wsv044 [Shrimp white spot syndrome virus]ATU83837.1 ORF1232 [White spot syndrome virus]AWQ61968.1 wsv044 [Shrimp white spot syndrome virus]AWQ62782.1 wsv044 [Shrimp white spot syndrome virus]